ncbi:MAG: thioredoxin domain-containing protein, partial [Methyloceanibacter sp.]
MFLRGRTASLLIAALALSGCGGTSGTSEPPTTAGLDIPSKAELLAPGPLGEHAYGNPSAPVTVIEYASLTCP